jgi:hypothetical protein
MVTDSILSVVLWLLCNFSITPGEGGEKRFGQAVQRRAGPVEWRG